MCQKIHAPPSTLNYHSSNLLSQRSNSYNKQNALISIQSSFLYRVSLDFMNISIRLERVSCLTNDRSLRTFLFFRDLRITIGKYTNIIILIISFENAGASQLKISQLFFYYHLIIKTCQEKINKYVTKQSRNER